MKKPQKMGLMIVLSALVTLSFCTSAFAATTKTVSKTLSWKSLVGLTVAKHTATTFWTYDGTKLISSPKGVSETTWSLPPTSTTGTSHGWDWYTSGTNGTGRSWSKASYVFGVPTPWGPVGSNLSDIIRTTVKYNGTYSFTTTS